jgi:hypothetical protein
MDHVENEMRDDEPAKEEEKTDKAGYNAAPKSS